MPLTVNVLVDVTIVTLSLIIIRMKQYLNDCCKLHMNCCMKSQQESHAVTGKPHDAAVNSDRYQQPVGQKQSE